MNDPNEVHEDDARWARLARYFAGEATEMERAWVEIWAASDPARAAELSKMERLWQLARSPCAGRVDAMWTSLSRRMRPAE